MDDQRKNCRLPIALPVELALPDGHVFSGTTRKLSFGGAPLDLGPAAEVKPGPDVTLTIRLQEVSGGISIGVGCKAIHTMQSGMGVRFVAVDVESYGHLRNLLLANSDAPDALYEETLRDPGILQPEE